MADAQIHQEKACTKCGAVKPASLAFFSAAKFGRGGLKAQCKECCTVYLRNWQRDDYRRDSTKRTSANRRWREANIEKCRERDRKRGKLRDRKEYQRQWAALNRDHVRREKAVMERRRRARKANSLGDHGSSDIDRIFHEQGGRCFYCSDLLTQFECDHFIPLARGGSNGAENIRIACSPCNRSKAAKMPWEWMPDKFKKEANFA